MPNATAIVAYLALFATVGFLFVFVSLILGSFLRAYAPTAQKLETYECGEPAIGPGTVQFDLRFYVVALLFLIFEVEVAFFFPPAVVFGSAIHAEKTGGMVLQPGDFGPIAAGSDKVAGHAERLNVTATRRLALIAMIDLAVFFAVLLVGFAFIWRRGDLDWVRAVRHPAVSAETAALMARLQRSDRDE